jgi:GNAT superfamily N-acetyltransferase
LTVGARDVGWSEVREAGGALLPAQLYVEPAFQGRGIGTAVVSDLLARAGAAGMPVDLSVPSNNGRARALYGRLGFRAVGEDGLKIHMRWG